MESSESRVQGFRRVSPLRGDDDAFGTPISTRPTPLTTIPAWFRKVAKRGLLLFYLSIAFDSYYITCRLCIGNA